jgi:hypothetical protein
MLGRRPLINNVVQMRKSASHYILHKAGTSPLDHPNSGHKRTSTPLRFPVTDVALPRLNMTPRSPKHQHPKTATISRRHRYRADQNFSILPPEIPHLGNIRPHRAATLPEPRHDLLDPQRHDSQDHQAVWGIRDLTEDPQLSEALQPSSIGERQPVYPLLEQILGLSPHSSPHVSNSVPVSTEGEAVRGYQQPQYSESELPPSPLASVTDSLDLEPSLTSTNPRQSHIPIVDLQEMR